MIKHGFLEKDIEPSQVHDTIKDLLEKENFAITSDDSGNMMWEIHAKKSSRERIIFGRVRDVDTVVSGSKGKFEVQLHAGIWGRDMAVPAIEGIATLGIATGVELHSGHEFEMRLWEQIVHKIDPSLKICNIDGLLFKNDQDLQTHMKTHQASPAMGMGMMGMGMMGIMGMGMMMPGMWI